MIVSKAKNRLDTHIDLPNEADYAATTADDGAQLKD